MFDTHPVYVKNGTQRIYIFIRREGDNVVIFRDGKYWTFRLDDFQKRYTLLQKLTPC